MQKKIEKCLLAPLDGGTSRSGLKSKSDPCKRELYPLDCLAREKMMKSLYLQEQFVIF